MGERTGAKRIDFMLDQLRKNPEMTRDEMDAILQERRQWGIEADERGRQSVGKVVEALSTLPEVSEFKETERHSPRDKNGLDLQVTFTPEFTNYSHLHYVWVQVKSSQRGVEEFLREHADSLVERRLVVLNGSDEQDVIIESFLQQVSEIVADRR